MDALIQLLLSAIIWFGLKILDALPGKYLDVVIKRLGFDRPPPESRKSISPEFYPAECGDRAIDLGYRKPHVAESFGGYFAGLLEDSGSYLRLDEQIESPTSPETFALPPLARILYEFRRPTGPQLIVIAGLGGMGKTTLATKIVKCLYEQHDAQFILGDSAKIEHLDPVTGAKFKLDPTFNDARSFYRRLYAQVGLPPPPANQPTARLVETLAEQLHDFHAIIVIDNLDTLQNAGTLLTTLRPLLSRDVRAIVTSRIFEPQKTPMPNLMRVNLKPLVDLNEARTFLRWHVQHYQQKRPGLSVVEKGLSDDRRLRTLTVKTGGIPLVMQLVLNDVETKTWNYLDSLPNVQLSNQLLDYLYESRWRELDQLGQVGTIARMLAEFVTTQQLLGKRITFQEINKWAEREDAQSYLAGAMGVLEDRFLFLNRDVEKGNFAVFPSFADFVMRESGANVA